MAKSEFRGNKKNLRGEINSLQKQIAVLQNEKRDIINTNIDDKTKLPVIVYTPGSLDNTEADRIEKKTLEEKLISPYIDYSNDEETKLVSLLIAVPGTIGKEYMVDAIFADGVYNGFIFGKRGREYEYWAPVCEGQCEFSETFKKKYPQIMQLVQ